MQPLRVESMRVQVRGSDEKRFVLDPATPTNMYFVIHPIIANRTYTTYPRAWWWEPNQRNRSRGEGTHQNGVSADIYSDASSY